MDKKLELECLYITEETAISASRFMGKGDEILVDKLAINEMKR
jgi:fructose-1,6-bisphosphatase/sedoheptulose 1,7-bisphosphatase-like protein